MVKQESGSADGREGRGGRDGALTRYASGAVIAEEGSAGSEMFIIEDGEVEIVRLRGGIERVLSTLGPGDFFGEMSVLERRPRSATARAKVDCRVLAIDGSTLDALLREHPDVAVRMMRKLSGRLREYEEQEERAGHAALAGMASTAAKAVPATPAQPSPAPAAALSPAPAAALSPAPAAARPGETSLAGFLAPDIAAAAAAMESRGRHEHASGWTFTAEADGEYVVGRLDPATGKTPEIDLGAHDKEKTLSRRHARLVRRGGRYFLREEPGTANGTWVGADRLATGVERQLADGDSIRFGRIDLVFRVAEKG
jgi:hypothetical protein